MSALIFDRTLHRIGLVRKLHRELELTGVWAAHNNVDSTSNGTWPQGMYKWSHYKAHPEEGLFPAAAHDRYGGMGIHVFTVPGRPGIGVHCGRTFGGDDALGGVTMGCIRVTPHAMRIINACHAEDRLMGIWVSNDLVLTQDSISV